MMTHDLRLTTTAKTFKNMGNSKNSYTHQTIYSISHNELCEKHKHTVNTTKY